MGSTTGWSCWWVVDDLTKGKVCGTVPGSGVTRGCVTNEGRGIAFGQGTTRRTTAWGGAGQRGPVSYL